MCYCLDCSKTYHRLVDVSVMTSDTEDSSDTIKPSHALHRDSTSGSRQSDNGNSRSSDTSGHTYPSVSSEARYDSPYTTASSSFPGGTGPSTSPTNITSLVSSMQSDGTHYWQDALRSDSPFGEMPRIPGNFPSDIASSRDNRKTLPGGFYAQRRAQSTSVSGPSNRRMSTGC